MLCSGIPNCLTTWTTTSPNISTHLCEESYLIVVVEAVIKIEFQHVFFLTQNMWLPSFQKALNIYSLDARIHAPEEARDKVIGGKQDPILGCVGSNNISLVLCFTFLLVVEDDCWSA